MQLRTNRIRKQPLELAIDGGIPVRTSPVAPWPAYGEEEVDAALRVLRSGRVNYWTGEEGRCFEEEFAALTNCKYAVAVANGTVALELALYALGVGSGDEVIVPARTFIASASCAIMRGATPVIADIDSRSQNITTDSVEAVLTAKTKAIIAVHLAGWPCDMDSIMAFARDRNIKVIEDCAQAHGASYKGRPVGSMGDAAAFSFCQDKIMSTAGEGGMVTTSDKEIWERAWSYKDHGKNYAASHNCRHPSGFRWLHESFGTNWRLTEMQSAIGRALIKKLPVWVEKRRKNASFLTERLSASPGLRLAIPSIELEHSYYKYYAFVRSEALKVGWNRDRIMEAISAEGIPCFVGSCGEIYLEDAFRDVDIHPQKRLRIARELAETSLTFLVHPTLSKDDMEDTSKAVLKVLAVAQK